MFGRAVVVLASAALFSELSLGAVMAAPAQSSGVTQVGAQVSAGQVQAAAAKRRAVVTVTALSSSTVRVNVLPLLSGGKTWKFSVQQGKTVTKTITKNKRRYKVKVTKWSSVVTTRTATPSQTRVVSLKEGRFRVYVPAQNKYQAAVSSVFEVPLDIAVPTPTMPPMPSWTPIPAPTTLPATPPTTTGPVPTPTPTPTSTPTLTPTPGGSTSTGGSSSSGSGGGTSTSTAQVPTSPQALRVASGNGSITVSWFMPFSDGGSPVTGYIAYANDKQCTGSATATSCVIENLVNGTAYRVSVVARNAVGNSAPAALSDAIVPSTVPDAPTGVTGVALRDGNSVVVSWTPGGNGGLPVTKYRVVADPGGSSCETTDTKCTFSGLATGTAYRFTVAASNDRGKSMDSAPSSAVVPVAPPGAPYNLTVVKGAAQVQLSWNVSANGSTIVKSVVVATPTSGSPISMTVTGDPAPKSLMFTGLTNGMTYTFKVTSTNALGWEGLTSAPSAAVTPRTVPRAPASLAVSVGRQPAQADLSWGDSDNGGAAITRYEVYTNVANKLVCRNYSAGPDSQASRSCVAYGLASGVPVQFRVRAYNVEGWSDWSVWSPTVSPS